MPRGRPLQRGGKLIPRAYGLGRGRQTRFFKERIPHKGQAYRRNNRDSRSGSLRVQGRQKAVRGQRGAWQQRKEANKQHYGSHGPDSPPFHMDGNIRI